MLEAEGQAQFLRDPEIVIAFHDLFTGTRRNARVRVPDAPSIERIEHQVVLELEPGAVEPAAGREQRRAVACGRIHLSGPVAPAHGNNRCQLLIDAYSNRAPALARAVVAPVPHAIISLG